MEEATEASQHSCVRSCGWVTCCALDTSYSADLPIIVSRFPKRHMATVASSEVNEARTVYTILLWTAGAMTSPNIPPVGQ